jgi:hypothetical protein
VLTEDRTAPVSHSPTPWRVGLWLILPLVFSGCFSYAPIHEEGLTPESEVRVRLSATASDQLSTTTGRSVRTLEGRVVALPSDSLRLDVAWGAVYAGTPFEGRRDTLSLHRSQVLEVEERQFSRTRTGVVAGGLVAGVLLVLRSLTGSGTDTGPVGPGPGDPL